MSPIIEVRRLQKHYGGRSLCATYRFASTKGVLSLLGASGSGKTTTLRMIAGLETRPTAACGFADETSPTCRSRSGTCGWCSGFRVVP